MYNLATPQEKASLMERFASECKLLSRLHHPCIVQFLGVNRSEVLQRNSSQNGQIDTLSGQVDTLSGQVDTLSAEVNMKGIPGAGIAKKLHDDGLLRRNGGQGSPDRHVRQRALLEHAPELRHPNIIWQFLASVYYMPEDRQLGHRAFLQYVQLVERLSVGRGGNLQPGAGHQQVRSF